MVLEIPNSIQKRMDKLKVPKEKQEEMFMSFVMHKLGIDVSLEGTEFDYWTEISDNIVDFL